MSRGESMEVRRREERRVRKEEPMRSQQRNLCPAVSLGFLVWFIIVTQASAPAHAERIIIAYPSPPTSFLPVIVSQKRAFLDQDNFQTDLASTNNSQIIQYLMACSAMHHHWSATSCTAKINGAPVV